MANTSEREDPGIWPQLLWILLLMLPVLILFFLPTLAIRPLGLLWLWVFLAMQFFVIWFLLRARKTAAAGAAPPRMIPPGEQPRVIGEMMDVSVATEEMGVQIYRGPLHENPQSAYARLKAAFGERYLPFLQKDPQLQAAVFLVPRDQERTRSEVRPLVHWGLFLLTLITTTWAGAAHQGADLLADPMQFTRGLPYALGLMAILGCHEMGHYVAARRHRMQVTPPYFIPVPFALGTFGAFIRMRTPAENRKALFDMAVAGPLAGLVIAIPALLIGLRQSEVFPGGTGMDFPLLGGASVRSSILFGLLAKMSLGPELASTDLIRLSPLAFAGWLGLLVTALNLLPIGQLDGGHIARSMFGQQTGTRISQAGMWTLLLLALLVWPGLMLWALIIFFIARRGTPPLNDLTPVNPGRLWLGGFAFLLLALILVPFPEGLWSHVQIHCPYLILL